MTNEQINIAIAEHCGWRVERLSTGEPHGKPIGEQGPFRELPDYCNDLNAMHEAEKVLTADQWYEYDSKMPLRDPQKIHATARQRAEAFLRTLGKWEDAK